MPKLNVRPVDRATARRMCEAHPHAKTLPNTSRFYMVAYIDGQPAGLASWGYGVMPRHTPKHLFDDRANINDYLELCRFFVYDWTPKNTASKFLAITHRILRKYAPHVKWLYTYAAGFQGMHGGIYQAANYDYLGRVLCNSFIYIPDRGLVHNVPLYNRYHTITGSNNSSLRKFQKMFPAARRWCGYNFRYIYWNCSNDERADWLKRASFEVIDRYPTVEDDVEIWLEDVDNSKTPLDIAFAKTVPIIKLPTKRSRAGSIDSDATASHADQGGATPTSALQKVAAN